MDKVLYNEVSTLIDHSSANASFVMSSLNEKYEKTNDTKVNPKAITEILNEAEKYLDFLHNFKQALAEEQNDFTTVKDSLKQFIYRLVQLNVALEQKQNQQIDFTDRSIEKKDNSGYFKERKIESYIDNPTDNTYFSELETATGIKNTIDNLVKRTDQRITAAFGEFDSKEKADKIINMEFDHVTRYLIGLKQLREMGYTDMDNVIPVIANVTTLIYECFQLNDVLTRGERFYKIYDKQTEGIFKPYYIVMKGFSDASTIEDFKKFTDRFIENTYILNQTLRDAKERKLVCQFDFCKENEVHGIINTNPEEFIKIVGGIFKDMDLKVAYSDKNISSLKNNLMRMPYELYGGLIDELENCEHKINETTKHIRINHGKIVKASSQNKETTFDAQ